MKVKICGLTRAADAELAVALGASHVGIVLAPDSPRRAELRAAREVVAAAHGRAEPVLVCRAMDDDAIAAAGDALSVRRVQVHGADAVREARLLARGLSPMPVRRVDADATALPVFAVVPSAERPALLDGGAGGGGVAFDWALLGRSAPHGVFVAGGLTPDNVVPLLARRPWGIDVSSGVESAPGHKDHRRLRALFDAIARAAQETA